MSFRNLVFTVISTVALLSSSLSIKDFAFAEEEANLIKMESVIDFDGFTDVTKQSFAYDSIMFLGKKGIIKGYGNGKYGVKDNVTRGQVSALLARYLELDTSKEFDNPYADVKGNMFEKEVLAVTNAGYMQGIGNNQFNPVGVLTRAQMAVVLTNVFDLKVKKEEKFWDMDEGHWSTKSVQALYSNGITLGTGNNKYNPTGNVTREQYAEFLYRGIHLDKNFEAEPIPEQPKKPDSAFSKDELKRIDAINNKWPSLRTTYSGKVIDVNPLITPPYKLGTVKQQALQDALKATNFVRFLAYLPSKITLNEAFNKDAQAAALVNAVNGGLSHYPKKPSKMSDALYKQGYDGAGASNIGYGYPTIASSVWDGYMPDYSDSNRQTVGHRRWILSPRLKEVGFGYVFDKNGVGYTAMKVMSEKEATEIPYTHISWPSERAFPADFFGIRDPWSISLNDNQFDRTRIADVSVTLTRLNNGKKWNFSKRVLTGDGYFTINTDNYGDTPFTIIIQPKQTAAYKTNERYLVEVNNLYTTDGKKTKFQYETIFFDLKD